MVNNAEQLSGRAAHLDAVDPLALFRDRFVIKDTFIYLDGNSLGRLPKETALRIQEVVEAEWAEQLVLGWDTWLDSGTRIGDLLAPLIGAQAGEVVVADQTSVNLYKLASAALASSGRHNILTDSGNFPSDRYILGSIAEAAGGTLVMVLMPLLMRPSVSCRSPTFRIVQDRCPTVRRSLTLRIATER